MDSNQTKGRNLMCVGGVCDGERHEVQGGPGTIVVLTPNPKESHILKFAELLERIEHPTAQAQAYEVGRCVCGKDETFYLCPAGNDFMEMFQHLLDSHQAPKK